MSGWKEGKMYGWIKGWMDGWMDGRRQEGMNACMHARECETIMGAGQ